MDGYGSSNGTLFLPNEVASAADHFFRKRIDSASPSIKPRPRTGGSSPCNNDIYVETNGWVCQYGEERVAGTGASGDTANIVVNTLLMKPTVQNGTDRVRRSDMPGQMFVGGSVMDLQRRDEPVNPMDDPYISTILPLIPTEDVLRKQEYENPSGLFIATQMESKPKSSLASRNLSEYPESCQILIYGIPKERYQNFWATTKGESDSMFRATTLAPTRSIPGFRPLVDFYREIAPQAIMSIANDTSEDPL